ncbi:MAG: hypothetical protein HY903_22885 [Deltaproteobacteria bacterium]|nr:hypothetical protein [Deltaproteobacteria bacterium]
MKSTVTICAFGLVAASGCSSIEPCGEPPATKHLGDFPAPGLEVTADIRESKIFYAMVHLAWADCAFLASSAAADMNGQPLERLGDRRSSGGWCGCPAGPGFQLTDAPLPSSLDAVFAVVEGESSIGMSVPGLFAVGVTLQPAEQPLAAGGMGALSLDMPATMVVDLGVALTAGDPRYAHYVPATLQYDQWVFAVPAALPPGPYQLLASWSVIHAAASCTNTAGCTLRASVLSDIAATVFVP